jgi:transcriptional regulator with XRE-family HTH domain
MEAAPIARQKKAGMLIKERLKQARDRLGLSQTELSQKTGVALRVIVKREGQSGGVTSDTLVALANVLEVSIDWLCGLTADMHGHQQRILSEDENAVLVALRDYDLPSARRVFRDVFTRRALRDVDAAFPEESELDEGGEEPKR